MAEQTANPVAHAIEELGGADVVREIANGLATDGNYHIGVSARRLLRDLLVAVMDVHDVESVLIRSVPQQPITQEQRDHAVESAGKAHQREPKCR